jgi:hypothetical protein
VGVSYFETLFAEARQGPVLDLRDKHLGDVGAQALAQSEQLLGVTAVNLEENNIGAAGVRALVCSPFLAGVAELYLGNNRLGDDGTRALAQGGRLGELETLDLHDNDIGHSGALALAISSSLPALAKLSLANNRIGDTGTRALATNRLFDRLTSLDLTNNWVGDLGVQAITRISDPGRLTALVLSGNRIGDTGATALAECALLYRLATLALADNQIHLDGARALADSAHLARVATLILGGNLELPEAAQSQPEALRRYFRLLDALDTMPGTTARCILVGGPHAGKTTLARLLAGGDPCWSVLARTHGVETQHIAFPDVHRAIVGEENRKLDLHLWDSGGQSLQGMIHGLFFPRCPLFILVVRSQACLGPARAWLDMIVSLQHEDGQPYVIPVVNSAGNDTAALLEGLREFDRAYGRRIEFKEAVRLSVGPGADNDHAVGQLRQRIREVLELVPIAPVTKPLIGLANLVAALPHPQYRLGEFAQVLLGNPTFQETVDFVNEALERKGFDTRQDPRGLLTDLLFFLEREGRLLTILFDERDDRAGPHLSQRDGCVVISPVWIQKALYSLLPPEDEHPDHRGSETNKLAVKLRSPGKQGLPGLFRFVDLEPVWQECGIPASEYSRLLDILSQPRIGLVIRPDAGDRGLYFVPAYLEEESDSKTVLSENFRSTLLRSAYTEVLDINLRLDNGHRIWPHHFFYRIMVWLCSAPLSLAGPARRGDELASPFCLNDLSKDCMTLTHPDEPGIAIHLRQKDQRIWCFVEDHRDEDQAQGERVLTRVIGELMRAIEDALRAFGRTNRIHRQIPCPGCLRDLCNEFAGQATSAFASGLQKVHLWYRDVAADLASDDLLKCEVSSHAIRAGELRAALMGKRRVSDETEFGTISRKRAKAAAVGLADYLVSQGLAKKTGQAHRGLPPLANKSGRTAIDGTRDGLIDINTLKAWRAGEGSDVALEKFCLHLLRTFPEVRGLVGIARSADVTAEKSLRLIVAAFDALCAAGGYNNP